LSSSSSTPPTPLVQAPPDYENYDYELEWAGMGINDLAEKAQLRSWLGPESGGRNCLELGCGFGRITRTLEDCCFDEVIGVDFSWKNLKKARSRTFRSKTELLRADIRNLPLRSGHFDFVVMMRVAHHLAEPSLVLDEICRVTKHGSTVVISMPNPLLSKARKTKRSLLMSTGGFGHRIYSTPFLAYSHPFLGLVERKGTGAFENRIAKALERFRYLYLVDIATASLWFLKKNVFLKFEVRK
jgi:ubiquinone/menaquinone biosynthesis C-methylase UbiE